MSTVGWQHWDILPHHCCMEKWLEEPFSPREFDCMECTTWEQAVSILKISESALESLWHKKEWVLQGVEMGAHRLVWIRRSNWPVSMLYDSLPMLRCCKLTKWQRVVHGHIVKHYHLTRLSHKTAQNTLMRNKVLPNLLTLNVFEWHSGTEKWSILHK